MIKLKLKNGQEVTYDKPFDMESDKLLVKFRLVRDGEGEGPWIRLHPDDKEDHDNDVRDPQDKVRLGTMANMCLNGVPVLCITPYRMMGDKRPECDMNELIDLEGSPTFADVETGEQISAEKHGEWREKAIAEQEAKEKAEAEATEGEAVSAE